jgi:hypothetical protein
MARYKRKQQCPHSFRLLRGHLSVWSGNPDGSQIEVWHVLATHSHFKRNKSYDTA